MLPSRAPDDERPLSVLAVTGSLDEVFDVSPHGSIGSADPDAQQVTWRMALVFSTC